MSAIAFQAWLDSEQDFPQGVQLYAQHPEARPALLALFERSGPGPFTSKQLVQEIERLAVEQPTPAPVAAAANAAATAPTSPASPEQPADVAPLAAEKLHLFKEASNLHGTLRHLATDEERFKAACTIKANFRRSDEIFDALSYREKHGALPPVVESVIADDDHAGLLKRRNTLRTYISSQRGTNEKRAAWQAELAKVERKLNP
ncbi:MAG: hypothetical protein EOO57_07980 [Hymenobacter sp.]|nr:MAG: hypothetical protein EOO57_07980 [Hymenobacter sp.]